MTFVYESFWLTGRFPEQSDFEMTGAIVRYLALVVWAECMLDDLAAEMLLFQIDDDNHRPYSRQET